jgi:two-component system sensor kinase FixL
MTPLSLLNAFACAAFLALAVLVLRNNVRSLLNWSCALLLAVFMVWSLENAFHCNPRLSLARAELLGNIFSFGWVSWASLVLLFVLVFTRRRRVLHTWPVVLLMTGLPVTLIVEQWAGHLTHANVQASFGWVRTWSNSIWSVLFYAYYLSFTVLAFYFLLRFRSETKDFNERKQAGLIFVTGLIAMVLGSATDVVLPLAGARVPQLAAVFSLIWAGGLYYSVTQLGMMRITPKAAAAEIIATMRDSLLLLTPEGRIVSVNQAALDLLEYSEAELVGKPASLLFTSPGLYEAALQQVRQEGELKYIELTCRTRLGKELPASISARVMRQGRNVSAGLVWVLRDISGRQEHEAALRRAYNELEHMVRELTQAQAELVKREKLATVGQIAASMAHELRNPLGAMHNAVIYLNMAERQALSEKGLRHLAVIDSQIERSNRIITALLNFAESQPAALRRVEFPGILESVLVELCIPEGVAVERVIPAGLPPLFADPEQVGVALRNLIENAFLAMPDGGQLTLRAGSTNGRNGTAPQVQVQVEDTGCGIKAEHLPRLFEPLFSTRTIGVGLGLAVCKKLVEANHGSIAVKSEPGKGAVFTVTLPAAILLKPLATSREKLPLIGAGKRSSESGLA